MEAGSPPFSARLSRASTELGYFLPETPMAPIASRQGEIRGCDWALPWTEASCAAFSHVCLHSTSIRARPASASTSQVTTTGSLRDGKISKISGWTTNFIVAYLGLQPPEAEPTRARKRLSFRDQTAHARPPLSNRGHPPSLCSGSASDKPLACSSTKAANFSGPLCAGTLPVPTSTLPNSCDEEAPTNTLPSSSTIRRGVPAGAAIPPKTGTVTS